MIREVPDPARVCRSVARDRKGVHSINASRGWMSLVRVGEEH